MNISSKNIPIYLAKYFFGIFGYRLIKDLSGFHLEKNLFFDEFRVYLSFFKATQEIIIFDVGAHTGESTKAFLRVFSKGHIHCFEPAKDSFLMLQQKFLNNSRITLNGVAVGSKNAIENFFILGNICSGNSIIPLTNSKVAKAKVEVPVLKLDDYCIEKCISNIDILKIDTQGYERECLEGAKELLASGGVGLIKLEIMLHDTYSRITSFFLIEEILHPYGYYLHDISWIKKSSRNNCTLVVDAIYAKKR